MSIIIPVYNERENLRPLIAKLMKVKWPVPIEMVFVDDGSTDESVSILRGIMKKNSKIRLLVSDKNSGKSAAIARGLRECRGEIVAIQDADLEYEPADLCNLVKPILDGNADVVYGSRFRSGGTQVHRTYHRLINRVLSLLSNLASGIHVTDMETCYKVFRSDIAKSFHIRSARFGFEPEITAYIAKFNLRVWELPVSYYPRTYLQGKKIRWTDGVWALWYIFKFNFLVSAQACLRDEKDENHSESAPKSRAA